MYFICGKIQLYVNRRYRFVVKAEQFLTIKSLQCCVLIELISKVGIIVWYVDNKK